jgi:GTP pyrophosphokinase
MDEKLEFTPNERQESLEILERLRTSIGDTLKIDDEAKLRDHIHSAIKNNLIQRDVFGLNPILHALRTAQIAVDEIGLKRDGVLAILLYTSVVNGYATADEIKDKFGDNVAHIIRGLVRIHELYKKNPVGNHNQNDSHILGK